MWIRYNVDMENVVATLETGGVAAVPTDTVYGLVASALDAVAVERVYELKDRDASKPLIVLLSGAQEMRQFGIGAVWMERARAYWPGAVTVVVPCENGRFKYLHRGSRSLGFRVPDDSTLQEILTQTGPLVAPSANPEGLPPAETVEEAEEYFGAGVDAYMDGGVRDGSPSKIIKLTEDGEETLR